MSVLTTTTDFHVSFGGDHRVKNHEVCFSFKNVAPDVARVPVVETINAYLPTLKALRVSDSPDSDKATSIAHDIRVALWKKLPTVIGLAQVSVKIVYSDTPAVEHYLHENS